MLYKKLMQKNLKFLFLFLTLLPTLTLAADITLTNPIEQDTFDEFINAIIDVIFNLLLALMPIIIIIGAYFFITAGDDLKKVETGKKIIFYAIVGFIIVLAAKGLVTLLKNALGVKSQ